MTVWKKYTALPNSALLRTVGVTLITDREKILKRWSQNFESVLNRSFTINDEAIDQLPHIPIDETLDAYPTLKETTQAITHMSMVSYYRGNSINPSSLYDNMRQFHMTSKTHPLCTLTKVKETAGYVTITVDTSSPLQAKSWQSFLKIKSSHRPRWTRPLTWKSVRLPERPRNYRHGVCR